MPSSLIVACVALFGLALGSFNNVLISRIPVEKPVSGRSQCPSCATTLQARDLVPVVSWVLLRRRCRTCRQPISAIYPAVEVITALMVVLTWIRVDDLAARVAWVALVVISVALAVIDLQTMRLPDPLVFSALAIGSIGLAINSALTNSWAQYRNAWISAIALMLFFYALRVISRGGMGFGDVKLAAVLGQYLGYFGWTYVVIGTFLGFLLGGIVGIGLIAAGKANRKSPIPYGPFMLLGAWFALYFTQAIAQWAGLN